MRKPMVTRSFTVTVATAICLDVTKTKPETISVVLPRKYTDKKKALKLVKEQCETDTYKVVDISNLEYETKLYGMAEQDFLDNAIELDPESRKPTDEEEDEEYDEDEDEGEDE